ncbi:hypothetical protein BDQ12DRAFT_131590 [Crucibulum laeve]|uniref:Glycan binding protein Y3-like domain-containing protein n=1 Tax=Crucibulum laeve TaxID=68775 RepID=A0A5C3LYL7_9AGAR|nr:hypothetical protein BDQ12DRAFT_131590 [Crucibulum laeve]
MIFNYNMVLTATVLAFSMMSIDAAAPVVRRTCYTAGTVGTECKQFINNFCNSVTANVAFGDNQERCYNTPNFKCDFGAFYEFSADAAPPATIPSVVNCINTLNNVTNTCGGFGGFGNVAGGGFTFTLDPNQGQCGQLEAPGS